MSIWYEIFFKNTTIPFKVGLLKIRMQIAKTVPTLQPNVFVCFWSTTNVSDANRRKKKSGDMTGRCLRSVSSTYFFSVSFYTYRKVASSSMSWLVAHFQIFRRLKKGKFDAYVLWPLAKKFQNLIVDWSTARDFTVDIWRETVNQLILAKSVNNVCPT